MNPAEILIRVKLMQWALGEVAQDVSAAAEQYRASVGARSLESDLGQVSVVRGKPAAYISDHRAFEQWVAEHHPDEIVTSVRSSFKDRYVKLLRPMPDGTACDADGVEVPFAASKTGQPYLRTVLKPEAKAAAAEQVMAQVESWTLPEVEQ